MQDMWSSMAVLKLRVHRMFRKYSFINVMSIKVCNITFRLLFGAPDLQTLDIEIALSDMS